MKVIVRRADPSKYILAHGIRICLTEIVPFSVQEAETEIREEEYTDGRRSKISDRTRLSNRIIDLRTSTSQSIFRVQSGVGNLFRNALDEQGFIEIHTPK
jgi:ergosteryl-3beta-O-L-aspartate synthase